MSSRRVLATLAVVGLSAGLVLGCGNGPITLADPEPSFDRGGNGGGGGGKGGGGGPGSGGDFKAELSFRDVDTDGDGVCDDANGDGSIDSVCGDGGGAYPDQDVRDDGVLLWNIGPRSFGIDLGGHVPGTAGCEGPPHICRLPGTSVMSETGSLRVLVLGATDNSQELDGHLLGMSEGIAYAAKFWTNVLADGTEEGVKFGLFFQYPTSTDDLGDPINPQIAAETSFLTITRIGNTWTLTAAGDDLGLVFSRSGKGKKGIDIRDEGLFQVPFEMTVTCSTCPPAGG